MIYAMAVEKLAQIEVPERAHFVRSIYLELARVGSHLFGLWAYANMLGFDTVAQWAMYHRDLVLDLFEELTGGRVYHIYIWPGGVRRDFPPGFKDKIVKTLHSIGSCVPDYDSTFFNNRVFYERANGIGRLTREQAKQWGATGQTLRATGMRFDIRKVEPYAAYEKVDWDVPVRKGGDAYSRVWVIRDEMIESVHMIFKLLDAMPGGPVYNRIPNPFKWKVPAGDAYVRCESSRGELGLYMVSNGGGQTLQGALQDTILSERFARSGETAEEREYSRCWKHNDQPVCRGSRDRQMKEHPTQKKGSVVSPFKAIRYLFRKPQTLRYPFEPKEPALRYRGFHLNDWDMCTGCGNCADICPNDAVTMVEIPEMEPRPGRKNERPKLDYGRCCFCGLCVDICPSRFPETIQGLFPYPL